MSLSRISFTTNAYQGDSSQSNLSHIREGFRQLLQAIKDGNLIDARQTYKLLTDMMLNTYEILSGQLKKDYHAIGHALQVGDMTGAQKAVADLQQDLQNIGHAGQRQQVQNVAEYRQPAHVSTNIFSMYTADTISAQTIGRNIDIII